MGKNGKISCRHVPEELVIEIMLKLPVKSLLRYKTLSKYWYNLFTSSNFIYNHFRNHNCTRLLAGQDLPTPTSYEFGFAVLSDESLSSNHNDLDYLRTPFYVECMLGPVNGLFLLGNGPAFNSCQNYRLGLLNPATRELKTLFVPDSNLQNPGLSSFMHRFLFGFDQLTNDFKVVAFWNTKDDGLLIDVNIAVYSLVNDSWKHLSPNMDSPPRPCGDAPYMNGTCYWLSKDYSILLFDFGSESLGEINGPQHIPISDDDYTSLFIYNYDSLAMFIGTYSKENWDRDQEPELGSIDVLVRKEGGCWTKHLTLDVSLLNVVRPVGVWMNRLLFETVDEYNYYRFGAIGTTKMVLYNPTTDETDELDIQPHDYNSGDRWVFIYN